MQVQSSAHSGVLSEMTLLSPVHLPSGQKVWYSFASHMYPENCHVVEHTSQPWFNSTTSEARCCKRQLQCWLHHSHLLDHTRFKQQCKLVRKLVSFAKSACLTNLIESSNPFGWSYIKNSYICPKLCAWLPINLQVNFRPFLQTKFLA